MIGYLDTSAFVPLLVDEPSSGACRRFWDDADAVVSNRLLYVETTAALSQAHRMRRLDDVAYSTCRHLLDQLWPQIEVIEIDEELVLRAAELADRCALRGYDAIHCSSAEQLDDPDLVAASGDKRLLDAWQTLGVATFDTNSRALAGEKLETTTTKRTVNAALQTASERQRRMEQVLTDPYGFGVGPDIADTEIMGEARR
ncbi:type II toxin-antitoxin system VapC family toxin [Nocardia amamiensis]|uniref:Ribonuclease VapC n=1 Tax=Nocardia amamiensis TaxID=404578 RepID=A0ABS0CS02_9NOCA|nr:type II toxin-antitoxin system VapC family toxin [Nocardia amamiensis]MBF6298608.1 type II toxin-antitoxin system VapC family toxin [Nocardia amamiensis]